MPERPTPPTSLALWLQRLPALLAGVFVLVLGFFFLAAALAAGAILATVIAARWWWFKRKLRQQAHDDVVEAEYYVVERAVNDASRLDHRP